MSQKVTRDLTPRVGHDVISLSGERWLIIGKVPGSERMFDMSNLDRECRITEDIVQIFKNFIHADDCHACIVAVE